MAGSYVSPAIREEKIFQHARTPVLYIRTFEPSAIPVQWLRVNSGRPEFVFKVISYHKTPLNRQIKEAIMIRRRGGATEILNSRSEFNRCHIPRLVVEVEEEEIRKAREQKEEE